MHPFPHLPQEIQKHKLEATWGTLHPGDLQSLVTLSSAHILKETRSCSMLTQPQQEVEVWKFREEVAQIKQQYTSRDQTDSENEQRGPFLRASIYTTF